MWHGAGMNLRAIPLLTAFLIAVPVLSAQTAPSIMMKQVERDEARKASAEASPSEAE